MLRVVRVFAYLYVVCVEDVYERVLCTVLPI